MEEQAQPTAETRVSMRRVLLDVGPPSIAHHIGWIRAGSEILLEIGYLDHRAMHEVMRAAEQKEPGLNIEVEWFVTNRFTFTRDHAPRLAIAFSQLTKMLESLSRDDDENGESDETK